MKNDTFNIPALKFVVGRNIEPTITGNIREVRNTIDFENIDGLTASDILATYLFGRVYRGLSLYCYFGVDDNNFKKNEIFSLMVSREELMQNEDETVDKIIEGKLEEMFVNNEDIHVRKAIQCFFERYQDNTHQDTLSRIKKIRR